MYKMFNGMRNWMARFFEVGAVTEERRDPLSHMSPQELADLPVYHPQLDRCLSA